ncbi:MAG: hypothetical protein CW338_10475 [Clostridiales bacterium]|nr:hypothetical protein [Clostridiales bacterium]
MRKVFACLLLSIFFFLFEVCVMSDLTIAGVNGYLLFAFLGVVIVSLGRKYAYCVSMFFGICLYCSVQSLGLLDLVMYPVCALLASLPFADRSEKKREQRALDGKSGDDLPAPFRILFSCAMMCAIYHTVCIAYSFLSNSVFTIGHIARALLSILYTEGLTVIIMFPCRAALGIYAQRRRLKKMDREMEKNRLKEQSGEAGKED